jgi:hypothetical protein
MNKNINKYFLLIKNEKKYLRKLIRSQFKNFVCLIVDELENFEKKVRIDYPTSSFDILYTEHGFKIDNIEIQFIEELDEETIEMISILKRQKMQQLSEVDNFNVGIIDQNTLLPIEKKFLDGGSMTGEQFLNVCLKNNINVYPSVRGWIRNNLTEVTKTDYKYIGKYDSQKIKQYIEALIFVLENKKI